MLYSCPIGAFIDASKSTNATSGATGSAQYKTLNSALIAGLQARCQAMVKSHPHLAPYLGAGLPLPPLDVFHVELESAGAYNLVLIPVPETYEACQTVKDFQQGTVDGMPLLNKLQSMATQLDALSSKRC